MGEAAAIYYIVAAAAAAAGAKYSHDAAEEAEEAGEKRAEAARLEGEEKKRKLQKEATYRKSLAKARAGASGIKLSGSVDTYLEAMDEATAKDLAWLDKATAMESSSAISSAELASLNSMSGAWGSLSNAASLGYSAYNAS